MPPTATASAANAPARIAFPDLHPSAFEHPLDRAALQTLRKTPGLDRLFKKLASLHFERIVRLHFTADSLRLSPRQCPRIYRLMREGCEVLDMPEPELYLAQSPERHAVATGMDRFTVVVSSGMVDMLDDEELRVVLANQLGHIKSGHMLYKTIAIFLGLVARAAARNLPLVQVFSTAMLYAFYDWSRKSELSADRASLLVAQDPDVVVRTLLKLAGGAQSPPDELNVEEFLKQADEFEDMDQSLLDVFYRMDMTLKQTHPFPALRAREITRWAASDEYRRILQGDYPRADSDAEERRCPKCAASVTNPLFHFCPECGAAL